jgi:hypothetical protein
MTDHDDNAPDPGVGIDAELTINGTFTSRRTKPVENPDGELIGLEVDEKDFKIGNLGPAQPCCDAEGGEDEHDPSCAYAPDRRDDEMTHEEVNDWLRRGLRGDM